MRMWVGIEKEGNEKGKKTLFVCSDLANEKDCNKILEAIKEHKIDRLYLGGGRKNVLYWIDLPILLCVCSDIVVEIAVNEVYTLPPKQFCDKLKFVITFRNQKLPQELIKNSTMKIENWKELMMFEPKQYLNIEKTVIDDKYVDDQIILDESI